MWRRRPSYVLVALGLLGSGQAHAQLAPTPSGASSGYADSALVAVQGVVKSSAAGAERRFASGERLHSGDRIALQVAVDQPLYVYLVARDPSGAAVVIFPQSGDAKLAIGKVHTLPSDGSAIEIDEQTGEEELFVIATRYPLPRHPGPQFEQLIQSKLAAPQSPVAQGAESGPTLPPPPAEPIRPPPMPIRTIDRDPKTICVRNLNSICARTDRGGVAVARLSFSHIAPRSRGPVPTTSR